jgi:hypothetical protein
MAIWSDILRGFGGSAKDLLEELARLEKERAVIRVEIEGSAVHFNSRLSLKKDTVVVAKPTGLRDGLSAGGFVRFKLPDAPEREVRLEILTPHFNLASGNAVFLCRLPAAGPAAAKRKTERYNVTHFANVQLVIGNRGREFRVVDVSLTGCKVLTTPAEAQTYFPLNREVAQVHIQVGSKAKVELEAVIARSHLGASVGCEFTVRGDGPSQVYLSHLIKSLEKAELERLRT